MAAGQPAAPVLVIGSPFLWWMRVAELRAVLAPVVAGTGPSANPDIAAARRFVRGLDAAVADAAVPGQGRIRRIPAAFVGWIAKLLLRGCRGHAAEMERCVAAAASGRAQEVDYGLRIAAQEQVGLAYAGWDRLLTRVALPAWRMGRWPSRLDAGCRLRAHGALPPRPAGRGLHLAAGGAPRLRSHRGARRGRRGGFAARRPALPRRPGGGRSRLVAGRLAAVSGRGRGP